MNSSVPILNFIDEILKSHDIQLLIINDSFEKTINKYIDEKEIDFLSPFIKKIQTWIDSFENETVYFYSDLFNCNYAGLILPDTHQKIFCGPILTAPLSTEHFQELLSNMDVPASLYYRIQGIFQHIPLVYNYRVSENIFTLLANELWGKGNYKTISSNISWLNEWHTIYNSIQSINNCDEDRIAIIEKRYKTENKLIDAVKSGNESIAINALNEFYNEILPQRITDNITNIKYYMITLNTLLRKAAESAGVHPIHINDLSNSNVQKIDSITMYSESKNLCNEIALSYCFLIHQQNAKNHSELIQNVLIYIQKNFDKDLSLKALSSYFNVNASYLSAHFKSEMGIALTSYVNTQRVDRAKKLLATTSLPIQSIAILSGIEDITYFNRVFKKITSTSPKAYRSNPDNYI